MTIGQRWTKNIVSRHMPGAFYEAVKQGNFLKSRSRRGKDDLSFVLESQTAR